MAAMITETQRLLQSKCPVEPWHVHDLMVLSNDAHTLEFQQFMQQIILMDRAIAEIAALQVVPADMAEMHKLCVLANKQYERFQRLLPVLDKWDETTLPETMRKVFPYTHVGSYMGVCEVQGSDYIRKATSALTKAELSLLKSRWQAYCWLAGMDDARLYKGDVNDRLRASERMDRVMDLVLAACM